MKRSQLVVANWKLNGNLSFNEEFMGALNLGLSEVDIGEREIVICPPAIFLHQLNGLLTAEKVLLGGQDVSDETSGAFTGEISAAMYRELGCKYVLVGHSERRIRHSETPMQTAHKSRMALSAGVIPILCIGETSVERDQQRTKEVLSSQLEPVFEYLQEDISNIVIAYEPVWAIGTGVTATDDEAQEIHEWIRLHVASRDSLVASTIQIIYGGSVKASNADALLDLPDVDGILVGGASLIPDEFLKICLSGIHVERK